MKKSKILVALLSLATITTLKAQEQFKIEGTVKPQPKNGYKVYLFYSERGGFKSDSSVVIDGKFHFEGTTKDKLLSYLTVPPLDQTLPEYLSINKSMPSYQIGIYLENGTTKVQFDPSDMKSVVVSGTPDNDVVQESRVLLKKYSIEEAAIRENLRTEKDSIKERKLIAEYEAMTKNRAIAVGDFIKKHNNSLVSLDLLKRWVNPSDDLTQAKKYFNYLSKDLQESSSIRGYKMSLVKFAKVDIDSLAPNFSLKDTSGNFHNLNDYKGKYVLVDFWASWCVPCIQEMPNVSSAYSKFKEKNFEILGVSLDGGQTDSEKRWANAITRMHMSWPQLSDLMGWNSSVAKLYMVDAIPMNFLIDPNGKIIAKNLRGQDLEKALDKYIKS